MNALASSNLPDRDLNRHMGLLVGLGVIVVALGALTLLAPFAASIAVAVTVGALFLVAGIAQSVLGIVVPSWKGALFAVALGALGVLAGAAMLLLPLLAVESLTLLVAAYFLVHGVFQTIWSVRSRREGRSWGWGLLDGIVSIVLGAAIWIQWPVSGLWALGVLAGIKLIFTGAAMVGVGATGRARAAGTHRAGPTA